MHEDTNTERPEAAPSSRYPSRDRASEIATALLNYTEVGECWIYNGSVTGQGYPQLHVGRGNYAAVHREACIAYHGEKPGAHALHSCDTKRCINPAHLSWGTARQNLIENRDRLSSLGNQRLTKAQAHEIKYRDDARTPQEVADTYGISRAAVYDIDRCKTWADV